MRRCFLLGDDPVTGRNFDHRKQVELPLPVEAFIALRARLHRASFAWTLGNHSASVTLSASGGFGLNTEHKA